MVRVLISAPKRPYRFEVLSFLWKKEELEHSALAAKTVWGLVVAVLAGFDSSLIHPSYFLLHSAQVSTPSAPLKKRLDRSVADSV